MVLEITHYCPNRTNPSTAASMPTEGALSPTAAPSKVGMRGCPVAVGGTFPADVVVADVAVVADAVDTVDTVDAVDAGDGAADDDEFLAVSHFSSCTPHGIPSRASALGCPVDPLTQSRLVPLV